MEFRRGQIEQLPIDDASIDVIISNCVINLSPDKDAVFREAFRVLRPGGRIQVSDIVWTQPVPEAVKADMEAWAGCIAGAMLREDYHAAITEAGFTALSDTISEYPGGKGIASANLSPTGPPKVFDDSCWRVERDPPAQAAFVRSETYSRMLVSVDSGCRNRVGPFEHFPRSFRIRATQLAPGRFWRGRETIGVANAPAHVQVNRILASIPRAELERLSPDLEPKTFRHHELLQEPDDPFESCISLSPGCFRG